MADKQLQGIFWYDDFDKYFLGHQFEEIFKARIYAPYLEGKTDPVVIDAGGNIGAFSLYAAKYAKQVYTLEPSPEHCSLIRHMLDFNKITNVKLLENALYIENGKFEYYTPENNKTMWSLHQAVNDGKSKPQGVDAITFDTLFKAENIEHVDLCKIDIEGSETEVLSSEGFRLVAPKIDTIVLETHSWSGRHPNQIRDALKNNGFSVAEIPNDATILVAQRKGV
jgi:FkbM family methyltransferase